MATRHTVSELTEKMVKKINSKPKKIIVEASNPSFIIIDDKRYVYEKETYKKIDNVEHTDKVIFKEFLGFFLMLSLAMKIYHKSSEKMTKSSKFSIGRV